MKEMKFAPTLAMARIAAVTALVVLGSPPLRAQAPSAAAHIETYYRELMPTIRQAGRLSVRERDQRFAPAITAAFDLATITRLGGGPAWKGSPPAQQAAGREPFTRFIVADYASQIKD